MTELRDIKGYKLLRGVDMIEHNVRNNFGEMEDASICRFVLGHTVYTALEDPDDGYRSSMRELVTARLGQRDGGVVKNMFPAVPVKCVPSLVEDEDILEVFDSKTGRIVLRVGTEDVNDYYPSFVAQFHPEHMTVLPPEDWNSLVRVVRFRRGN